MSTVAATLSWNRVRQGLVGTYVVACVLSGLWAFSGVTGSNELGAHVGTGRTGEGSVYFTVRNGSSFEWTNVRIDADQQWFLTRERVGAGEQMDARMRELQNAWRVPRPIGLYFWEVGATDTAPSRHAPPGYAPETITIRSDQGTIEHAVTLDGPG